MSTAIRHFNRFELKYVLSPSRRAALMDDLRTRLQTDTHGDASGCYRVTSLYYDSPDLECYRAKIEGIKYRRKVRVRVYGPCAPSDDTTASVEIKQRIDRTVQKRRLFAPLKNAYALCAGDAELVESLDASDQRVAREILYLQSARHLEPAAVVSYSRTALVGSETDSGLRVTFDEDLHAGAANTALRCGEPRYRVMPPGWCVLEVKVNQRIPLWLARLLYRHNCQLKRVSKYCEVIRFLVQREGAALDGRLAWTNS